jgi:hypothetical protein
MGGDTAIGNGAGWVDKNFTFLNNLNTYLINVLKFCFIL